MKEQEYVDAHHRFSEDVQPALDHVIDETMREKGLMNALAMAGVVIGAFVLNLLILVLVTGG